jgi:hypothetical protein
MSNLINNTYCNGGIRRSKAPESTLKSKFPPSRKGENIVAHPPTYWSKAPVFGGTTFSHIKKRIMTFGRVGCNHLTAQRKQSLGQCGFTVTVKSSRPVDLATKYKMLFVFIDGLKK